MAAPDIPFPMQKVDIEFGEDPMYRLLDDLFTEGVVGTNDLSVQQYAGGARMSVQVNAGEAYVSYNNPYGGKRRVRQPTLTDSGIVGAPNTAENWTSTFTTADGTNPRIDRVVARLKDSVLDASTLYRLEYAVIAGTPTVGATLVNPQGAAAVPDNCILLANVLIPAGSSQIVTANIDTDSSVRVQSALGGRVLTPAQQGIPTGSVSAYAATSAPTGWSLCDGTARKRSGTDPGDGQNYAALWAVISTTYGAGDGSSTFNLPDLRGRSIVAVGTNAAVNALALNDGVAVGNRRGTKHRHTPHSHQLPVGSTGSGSNTTLLRDLASWGASVYNADGGSGNANDPLDGGAFLTLNYIIKL